MNITLNLTLSDDEKNIFRIKENITLNDQLLTETGIKGLKNIASLLLDRMSSGSGISVQ